MERNKYVYTWKKQIYLDWKVSHILRLICKISGDVVRAYYVQIETDVENDGLEERKSDKD